jgi:HAD superfamily hydrolase (TIGR01509 family)
MSHHLPDYTPPDYLDEFVQQLHAAKNCHYRQLLQEGKIPLRPGVKRVITEAYQGGIPLAIATTSSLENTMALLETQLGTDAYFSLIAAGDVVQEKKPAPDIYYYVLEQLDISADHCLVFEDSQSGLEAATQAHLKTVITVNDYTAHQNFSEAILVLNHLGEPDQPFTVYRGSDFVHQTYFDLSLAHSLFNA